RRRARPEDRRQAGDPTRPDVPGREVPARRLVAQPRARGGLTSPWTCPKVHLGDTGPGNTIIGALAAAYRNRNRSRNRNDHNGFRVVVSANTRTARSPCRRRPGVHAPNLPDPPVLVGHEVERPGGPLIAHKSRGASLFRGISAARRAAQLVG